EDKDALEWQGALTQLTLAQPASQRELRLEGEAPLLLGAARWSVGPATFASEGSTLRVQGNAQAGRMQMSAAAENPQLGRPSMALTARPQGGGQVSPQTPLPGRPEAATEARGWR